MFRCNKDHRSFKEAHMRHSNGVIGGYGSSVQGSFRGLQRAME